MYRKAVEKEEYMVKITINGMDEKQYRETYLRACDNFGQVNQDNVTLSWVDGLYYGYLIARGE